MKNTNYFLTKQGIKKCCNETTEAEFFGAETCYGYGNTLFEFEDGSIYSNYYCFELNWKNISGSLLQWYYSIVFKVKGLFIKNNNSDLF